MAKHLNGWLKAAILNEFREAIDWKRAKIIADRKPKVKTEPGIKVEIEEAESDGDDDDGKFADDGSNVRVDMTRPAGSNSNVQILRFTDELLESPYRCELFDGQHVVSARFAREAVSKLKRDSGRNMAELVGAMLTLKSFVLVITPFGPRDDRLQIDVELARFRQGSGTIMDSQRKLLLNETEFKGLWNVLNKFAHGKLDDETLDSVPPQGDDVQLEDHDGPLSIYESDSPVSQPGQAQAQDPTSFVSQVIEPERRKKRIPPAFPEVALAPGTNLAAPVNPKRDFASRLLSLGGLSKPRPQSGPRNPTTLTRDRSHESSVSVEEITKVEAVKVQPLVYQPSMQKGSPPTEAAPHDIPKQDQSSASTKGLTLSRASVETPRQTSADAATLSDKVIDQQGQELGQSPVQQTVPSAEAKELGLTREPSISSDARLTRKEISETVPVKQPEAAQKISSLSTISRAPDPRYMNYAKRRIPRDQWDLLQKKHSWIPSYPGESFPPSNVPIKVIKSLTERPPIPAKLVNNEHPHTVAPASRAADVDPTTISQQISTQGSAQSQLIEWSPSPPRPSPPTRKPPSNDNLPPDSSMELAGPAPEPSSSPPISQLDPASTRNLSDGNSDDDLPVIIPHRLESKKTPKTSAAAALVPSVVEVKQSPLKSSTTVPSSSSKPPIPATQRTPVSGLSSGATPAKAESAAKSQATPDVEMVEVRQQGSPTVLHTNGSGLRHTPPSGPRTSQMNHDRPSIAGSPPRKKQRSSLQFGSDEVASQDPAAKHAQLRREALRAMRQSTSPMTRGYGGLIDELKAMEGPNFRLSLEVARQVREITLDLGPKAPTIGPFNTMLRLFALHEVAFEPNRNIKIRPGAPNTTTLSYKHPNTLAALLATAAQGATIHDGEAACDKCRRGHGQFAECVTLEVPEQILRDMGISRPELGFLHGGCTNCHMNKNGSCSGPQRLAAGSAPEETHDAGNVVETQSVHGDTISRPERRSSADQRGSGGNHRGNIATPVSRPHSSGSSAGIWSARGTPAATQHPQARRPISIPAQSQIARQGGDFYRPDYKDHEPDDDVEMVDSDAAPSVAPGRPRPSNGHLEMSEEDHGDDDVTNMGPHRTLEFGDSVYGSFARQYVKLAPVKGDYEDIHKPRRINVLGWKLGR